MQTTKQELSLEARARLMQIIVAALAFGLLVFAMFAYILPLADQQGEVDRDFLGLFALAFAGVSLAATVMLRFVIDARGVRAMIRKSRGANNPEGAGNGGRHTKGQSHNAGDGQEAGPTLTTRLVNLYFFRTVVCAATLESTGLFLITVFMLNRSIIPLMGGIFFAGLVASMFPTRDRLERWVERQGRLVQSETFTA